jgi:hypothetical protein
MQKPSPNRVNPGRWIGSSGGRARKAAIAVALPVTLSLAVASPSIAQASVPTNCVPNIGACGYPDAETSGVPGTVVLQEVPDQVSSGPGWHFDSRGFVQVTGSGANLTGLLIPYNVNIAASNVTLQDDLITHGIITAASLKGGTPAVPSPDPSIGNAITLRHTSNVTIEDTTISGLEIKSTTLAGGIIDLFGDSTGLKISDDNIADTSVAVNANGGMISGNYIHSEMPGASGNHIAGIKSNDGSSGMTIEDNTILVGTSTSYAIGLFPTSGAQANRLIDNNILAGGNYVLYGGFNSGGLHTSNIRVTNNRFSRFFQPNGGVFGPVAHWDPAGADNVWSGNFWDNTLATIPEP